MSTRISKHIRSNVLGLVAIFIALGGTAYATHPGGADTISSGDIIDGAVRTADINNTDGVRSADVRDDTLPNGGLQAVDLRADSVGTSEVADESLGALDLAPDSVGSSEVAPNSLDATDLNASSVTSSELATGAIPSDGCCFGDGSTKLAAGSVGESELQVDSVTSSELRTNSVGQDEIRDGAVTSSDIGAGAVGTEEFASSIPAARVTRTVGQGIPENSSTTLNFDSERYDTANLHTTSSPNFTRLTAPVTGIYEVSASIQWEIDTSGQRVLSLRKNGTTTLAFETDAPVGLGIAGQTISTVARLAAGDFVEARAQQISGGTLNIEKSNEFSPEFLMTWLAPGP